jgi:hypothetical protein
VEVFYLHLPVTIGHEDANVLAIQRLGLTVPEDGPFYIDVVSYANSFHIIEG